jgi:nicotinate phosphoribosyltransferase
MEQSLEEPPALRPVMGRGRIIRPLPSLNDSREYFLSQFALLPEPYKALRDPSLYPVALSPGLQELQSRVERQLQYGELRES